MPVQRGEHGDLFEGGVARIVADSAEIATTGAENLKQSVEAVYREIV
jgi:hypothetical protein